MQIEHTAIAAFVLDHADYSADYEADEFVMELEGQRFYVERKRHWFTVHVGADRFKLPR